MNGPTTTDTSTWPAMATRKPPSSGAINGTGRTRGRDGALPRLTDAPTHLCGTVSRVAQTWTVPYNAPPHDAAQPFLGACAWDHAWARRQATATPTTTTTTTTTTRRRRRPRRQRRRRRRRGTTATGQRGERGGETARETAVVTQAQRETAQHDTARLYVRVCAWPAQQITAQLSTTRHSTSHHIA